MVNEQMVDAEKEAHGITHSVFVTGSKGMRESWWCCGLKQGLMRGQVLFSL